MNELKERLADERALLAECQAAGDTDGISTQQKVIRLLERQVEEAAKPARWELEAAGERYGLDFY